MKRRYLDKQDQAAFHNAMRGSFRLVAEPGIDKQPTLVSPAIFKTDGDIFRPERLLQSLDLHSEKPINEDCHFIQWPARVVIKNAKTLQLENSDYCEIYGDLYFEVPKEEP